MTELDDSAVEIRMKDAIKVELAEGVSLRIVETEDYAEE